MLDDLLLEGTETVTVTLTGTSNPSVGFSATPATVNILDDEASTASVAASDATGSEPGADDGTFTFSLTQTRHTDTKITYSIGGTATGGPAADYKALSGTVTILAGLKTADVLVDVLDDAFLEGTETVTVAITAVDNPAIGFSATPATVSILDNETGSIAVTVAGGDDAAEPADDGLFTFTLTGGPAPTDTKVNFTVAGGATPTPGANADYTSIGTSVTIPAGKSSATVLVDVIDDLLVESTETVIVTSTGTDNPAIRRCGHGDGQYRRQRQGHGECHPERPERRRSACSGRSKSGRVHLHADRRAERFGHDDHLYDDRHCHRNPGL